MFDIERECMAWANAAGVAFWCADSLAALRAHDFSAELTPGVRARLGHYLAQLQDGRVLTELWTLYPAGQPRTVSCRCRPASLEDGRVAMEVEVVEEKSGFDHSALRAAEATYHAPGLVSAFDASGELVMANPAAGQVLPADRSFASHVLDPDDRAHLRRRSAEDGEASIESRVATLAGTRHHQIDTRISRDPATGASLTLTYEYDVSERRALLDARATTNEMLGTLLDSLSIGVLVEDENRSVRHVNEAFCRIFGPGLRPEELLGANCADLLSEAKHLFADPDAFERGVEALLENQMPVSGEEWHTSDDRVLRRNYLPVFVGDHFRGHMWQYEDVTEQRTTEKTLRERAEIDWLTNLPNRRTTEARLRRFQRELDADDRATTLLMIDIDRFKEVNDRFGHAAGDRVLRDLATALRKVLRGGDVLGRVGGEEFLALLPDARLQDAQHLAERVRRAPKTHDCRRPDGAPLTVSVGMTELRHAEHPAAAQQRVDEALYAAKEQGRDRVVTR